LQNLQPDEDDYGYTSNISDEFHKKLMAKYKTLPEEKKFSSGSGKHKAMTKEEIQRAKDRVKNALTINDDDQHFRQGPQQRTSKIRSEKSENSKALPAVEKKQDKPKPKIRPAPIVDFQQLLKLAEQKQHEDITIEMPSKKEPERLLTSKEKRELEELEAMKRARMKPNRIPKLGAIPKLGESSKHDKNNNESSGKKPTAAVVKPSQTQRPEPKAPEARSTGASEKFKKPPPAPSSSTKLRDALQKNGNAAPRPSTSSNHKVPSSTSTSKAGSSNGRLPVKPTANGKPSSSSAAASSKPRPSTSKAPEKPRDFPPKDLMRSREFPPKDLQRSREFPPKDLMRSREFPPRDLKRPKQPPLQVSKKRE
jgi:protein SPT2